MFNPGATSSTPLFIRLAEAVAPSFGYEAFVAPVHPPADLEHITVRGVDAQVLSTPGHTEGSLCLYLPAEELLIAGDTLFAGSVGRTDLPGGSHPKLIQSIRESLLTLPDTTLVVPGHGPDTTIGEERVSNPFL